MSRINAGITGGFSGKINNVVGYRRLGKDIITGTKKFQSINIIPELLTNKQKFTLISNYVKRIMPMIVREKIRIGYEPVLDWDLLMKDNIKNWVVSEDMWRQILIIDHYRNKLQPTSVGTLNPYPGITGLTLSKLFRITRTVGTSTMSRTRYFEFNNYLQALDTSITVNAIGSGTPAGSTTPNRYYSQIETIWNIPKTYFSRMHITATMRP